MSAAEIILPDDLRPADGRFGSGPSKVPQAAVDRLREVSRELLGTSHRKAPVKSLVSRIRQGLTTYFALPDGYEVVLGVGGATLFWDAAAHQLIRARSAHAVFGEFSAKFAGAVDAAPWLEAPLRVASDVGDHPTLEAVDGVDTYALTHCETSTGVVMPITRPSQEGLVLVDATSAAGGVAVDPAAFDAYYFSPQKAFASDGGLWLALLSPAAVERVTEVAATGRYTPAMLDLGIAIENSRADQTYNTPALATLFLLAEQVDALNARGGLDAVADDCIATSGVVYDWAEKVEYASPFVTDPAKRSPVVCTIDLDERVAAAEVSAVLRANGIVDTDAYRKLGRNQLRVATFPAVAREDVEQLTAAIAHVVERLAG